MRSEWKEVKLEDITTKLGDGLHGTPKYDDNGEYYFINGNNIGNGKITITENTKRVNYAEYLKLQKDLNNRTILVSINGTLGNVGLYNGENVCLGKSACYFNVNEDTDKEYVKYIMMSRIFQQYINIYATGTTIKNMGLKAMRNFSFFLPPLPTQKKIAHILSTLDDKIELNHKMNETLEAMAQALFKSWFVDFDPVHAKVEAKSEPELEVAASALGISKEILDLFPSEFEESEMGMIPLGWEVKPFGELLSKTIGGDWGKEEPDEKHTEKVKIIRGTDIPKIKNISIEDVPTRYVEAKKLKTRELFDGDIIIEVSGGTKNQPTGRTLYVTNEVLKMLDGKVEPASFCRLFRPLNAEVGLILAQHMLYIYDQGKTWQYQNQSTGISNFQTTIFLEKEHVVIPSENILQSYYTIVRPLIEKSLSSENITLQKTRDTLLPKLLAGELDVTKI